MLIDVGSDSAYRQVIYFLATMALWKGNMYIGERLIGTGRPAFIIAEIGINHNGSIDNAKKLIDVAVEAGCDAVKFQKRTLSVVYSETELLAPRESVFGNTNGDLKRGLEFGKIEYSELASYCEQRQILWSASCWDEASVDFISKFEPKFLKIASASLTDDRLLEHHRKYSTPIILSTGMSDLEMIKHAVAVLGGEQLALLHCTSTYPSELAELNLAGIKTLNEVFPNIPVGYSGHETGVTTSVAAVALGACIIERHVTLDRARWGSDQAASLEPPGIARLVRDIRAIESSIGDGEIKIYDSERPIIKKLRRQ